MRKALSSAKLLAGVIFLSQNNEGTDERENTKLFSNVYDKRPGAVFKK